MGKKKLKVVLDTNVLVSSLLFKGELSEIISFLKKNAIILLFSEETLKEFIKVLHYPKFDLSEDEIDYIIHIEIMPYSEMNKVNFKLEERLCNDKEDEKFLELAISSKADYVVSGDKEILKLEEIHGIKINSPKRFLQILKEEGKG